MSATTKNLTIGSNLTLEQAETIFAQGREAVEFALLEFTKRLAEAEAKSSPSITPQHAFGDDSTLPKTHAQATRQKTSRCQAGTRRVATGKAPANRLAGRTSLLRVSGLWRKQEALPVET